MTAKGVLKNTPYFFNRQMRKLKILACPSNHGGCAYYRILMPMEKLAELHKDEVEIRFNDNPLSWDKEKNQKSPANFDFADIAWADVVFTQNIHNFGPFYTIDLLKKAHELGKFTHFDTDDLITDVYKGHRLHSLYIDNQLDKLTEYIYNNVDLVSVTQKKFAERIIKHVRCALVVIKNTIDYNLPCWNLPRAPIGSKPLKMGWVGGIHHDVDVKHFAGIPRLVNQAAGKENVFWGFYGRPPQPPGEKPDWQQDVWEGYERMLAFGLKADRNYRIFPALPPNAYGEMYTNIDVNLAILDDNPFNDSKSEIKAIEGARYGVPLVATNVGCYDELIVNGQTGYLISPNNPNSEWVKALSKCIKNPKHVYEMGQNLKRVCDELYDINKVVGGRLQLYKQILAIKGMSLTDAGEEQKEKNIIEMENE